MRRKKYNRQAKKMTEVQTKDTTIYINGEEYEK